MKTHARKKRITLIFIVCLLLTMTGTYGHLLVIICGFPANVISVTLNSVMDRLATNLGITTWPFIEIGHVLVSLGTALQVDLITHLLTKNKPPQRSEMEHQDEAP